MDNGYLAQIELFAGSFTPRNWAYCFGQLMPISGNEALFSLVGDAYGGDARTTFGLPDLRGRTVVGYGQGIGLTPRQRGMYYGTEYHYLTSADLPKHRHAIMPIAPNLSADVSVYASDENGTTTDPTQGYNAVVGSGEGRTFTSQQAYTNTKNTIMGPNSAVLSIKDVTDQIITSEVGVDSRDIPISQPSMVIPYVICTQGLYPSRS